MLNKIHTAISYLAAGQPFRIGDLRLEIIENKLSIIGWSKYLFLENITKKVALEEIEEIKLLFEQMKECSLELQKFVNDKIIEYVLYFDDSGKGSIIICSLNAGTLNWYLY